MGTWLIDRITVHHGGGRATASGGRPALGLDFLGLTDEHDRVILRVASPYATSDDLANDPYVAAALQGNSR